MITSKFVKSIFNKSSYNSLPLPNSVMCLTNKTVIRGCNSTLSYILAYLNSVNMWYEVSDGKAGNEAEVRERRRDSYTLKLAKNERRRGTLNSSIFKESRISHL